MSTPPIKIGTRDSQLAQWQAHQVEQQLKALGVPTEIVLVQSQGDLQLQQPLYEMGITGIFTKTLDIALLNGTIDIAVHSLKDVPTALPHKVVQTAVLPRASSEDILVIGDDFDPTQACTIATGSLRRKAQWLSKYPHHTVVNLRGNVNTRLQKLENEGWQGAIFAKAGLQRIKVLPQDYISLDWMLPAPAQGAICIVAREYDTHAIAATKKLNDSAAHLCTKIEREFLRTLEGGCTAPIGALAALENDQINFTGGLFSLDGTQELKIERSISKKDAAEIGSVWANELLDQGGRELMAAIRNQMEG